jgi:hypothetical protein
MHGELIPYESLYDAAYVRSYLYVPMYKISVWCGAVILYGYLYCTVMCGKIMQYADRCGAVNSAFTVLYGALAAHEPMYDAVYVRSYRTAPCTEVLCGVVKSSGHTVRPHVQKCGSVRRGGVIPSGDLCTILHDTLHGNVWYSHTTWRSVRYCVNSTFYDNVWHTRTV